MQLLNYKTLLVIASLLALILGLLARQEARAVQQDQEKAAAVKREQDFWKSAKEKEKKRREALAGGPSFDEVLKNHKPY